LHPADYSALRRSLPRKSNVQVHERDGWEAMNALLPPVQRRGLVLVDPPYEAPDELNRAAHSIGAALKRFGHGVYLWWRPFKSHAALDAADGELKAHNIGETLRADLWVAAPERDGKLAGSSLYLINPPFGLSEALQQSAPFLANAMSKGQSGWRLA
jgi:23S rRNA (adenine2030-N6)-methyltransferase